jgi:chaperonin GroEL
MSASASYLSLSETQSRLVSLRESVDACGAELPKKESPAMPGGGGMGGMGGMDY